ncbi:hypothetical protein NQ317_000673 [Molorchus minor]|uniref:Carboxylesterase type B domain-containing protein n=1 Tax=Molorchus minor TaxID=1323400 RepID=A0ABQ9JEG0_9CUCU|nr:hypothetical protein NQ317_000673 [Molorchus minor]
MFFRIFLIHHFLLALVYESWQQERKPVVRIQQGYLEGLPVYTESSTIVNSFLGIPYAAPPVDNLRFAPPQRHPGWNGTYRATNFQPQCPQLPLKSGITDVEDCLYLNIWAPLDLAAEGIVVVTVNYRLNAFGFFCLGTTHARGNFGLLDQYLALLWVKENIKYFGGDPEKVTLFGYLSGAVSVALHVISPRTLRYFKNAIISSGSVVTPWQINNDPIIASKEIIRLVGCHAYTLDVLRCLRTKKAEEILKALQEYSESNIWTDQFLPVVDNFLPENDRYLPIEPSEALKAGKFPQVPILTGVTRPITYPQLAEWVELASQGYSQLHQYMERAKIPGLIKSYRFNGATKDIISDLIKWKYASSSQGDVRLLFEQLKNLEFEAKLEAPHFLQLSHLITFYVQPIFVYYIDDLGISLNATDHLVTTDLLLLFGPALLKQVGRRRFSQNEILLSNQIKQMWKNFMVVGNPTSNNVKANSWRKYTAGDPYIEFFDTVNPNIISDQNNKRNKRVTFWNQLVPKIAQHTSTIAHNIPKELQNSPDPAAGFRHAMYTLVGLVIALMALLVICIVLLKKRSKERERHIHLGY